MLNTRAKKTRILCAVVRKKRHAKLIKVPLKRLCQTNMRMNVLVLRRFLDKCVKSASERRRRYRRKFGIAGVVDPKTHPKMHLNHSNTHFQKGSPPHYLRNAERRLLHVRKWVEGEADLQNPEAPSSHLCRKI